MYIVVSNSDGDLRFEQVEKEELLERVADNYYGTKEFVMNLKESDPNYWGDKIMIIKGEVVVPKPKKIIDSFDID